MIVRTTATAVVVIGVAMATAGTYPEAWRHGQSGNPPHRSPRRTVRGRWAVYPHSRSGSGTGVGRGATRCAHGAAAVIPAGRRPDNNTT
jgi:hypothetical protein